MSDPRRTPRRRSGHRDRAPTCTDGQLIVRIPRLSAWVDFARLEAELQRNSQFAWFPRMDGDSVGHDGTAASNTIILLVGNVVVLAIEQVQHIQRHSEARREIPLHAQIGEYHAVWVAPAHGSEGF